ncbi:MAG TPA: hypothetical protein VFY90_01890, partial [Tepidiformaceae bacterium]|nr:hypothetical protein [Tepidiformaceae bacterium]
MTPVLTLSVQSLTQPSPNAEGSPGRQDAPKSKALTLAEAIRLFARKNLAGRIPVAHPNAGEPQYTSLSTARCNVIIAHVRNGIRGATGREGHVDDVDLAPYLATLSALAHQDAVRNGRTAPANEASNVRTFLRALERQQGAPGSAYKRRVRRESFTPSWRSLCEAIINHPMEGDRYRRYLGWLETVQNVALLNGVRDPAALPDYATLKAWMLEAGHSEKDTQNLFVAYRTARELAELPQLPALEPPPRFSVRGLHSLPDLEDRIKAACVRLTIAVRRDMQDEVRRRGYGAEEAAAAVAAAEVICPANASEMRILDILDYLAPDIAHHTRQYLEWARTATTKSDDWRIAVETAAGCAVAELIRLGEDQFVIDHLDLFLERRTIQRSTTTAQTAHRSRRAVTQTGTEAVSLFRLLLDAMAQQSVRHSQLFVPEEQSHEGVPFYTPAVFNDKSALWSVTEEVYGTQLGRAFHENTAEEWREIEREYARVSRHMKEYNEARDIDGHVNRGQLPVNLGAVVCVGLREVWLRVRSLRTAWHLAYEKHGQNADAAPVRAARSRYLKALEPWALAALRLDDGMRGKQYNRGRVNVNFFLEGPRDPNTGALRAVTGIRVHNEGFDRVAGTKKRRKANGRKRERSRR